MPEPTQTEVKTGTKTSTKLLVGFLAGAIIGAGAFLGVTKIQENETVTPVMDYEIATRNMVQLIEEQFDEAGAEDSEFEQVCRGGFSYNMCMAMCGMMVSNCRNQCDANWEAYGYSSAEDCYSVNNCNRNCPQLCKGFSNDSQVVNPGT